MLILSWQMVRARWTAFVGTFIALALGVCLLATSLLSLAAANDGAAGDPLLAVAAALLATTAGVAGAAAAFVVAGTFSFAVALRRREFALLRSSGATPRQVFGLVLGEALVVGVLASLAGCALGVVAAPSFARWLAAAGLAPVGFTARASAWPLVVAGVSGLVVALLGATVAAFRASRVPPIEALRDAALDRRTMTPDRWLVGLSALAGVVALLPVMLGWPQLESAFSFILLMGLLALVAVAMLAPALLPLCIRALGWPLRGSIGTLAWSNALAALRRTSSTVAPIVFTIGLAGAALISSAMLAEAQMGASRDRIAAPLVAVAETGAGLTPPTVDSLGAVPGVRAVAPVRQGTVSIAAAQGRVEYSALYAGDGIDVALRLPALSGAISALRGTDTVALSQTLAEEQGWQVGDMAQLWLADSAEVSLRVVAILPDSVDLGDTLLLPWGLQFGHEPAAGADLAYVVPDDGAAIGAVMAAAAPVASGGGGRVLTTADYLAVRDAAGARVDRVALLAVVGLALVYTAIAVANTFVMATAGRAREIAVLRLGGATPGQALAMIAVEVVLVTVVGASLAAVVSTGILAASYARLDEVLARPTLVVPWGAIGLVATCCLAIALVASLLPAVVSLRIPAARLAAARE